VGIETLDMTHSGCLEQTFGTALLASTIELSVSDCKGSLYPANCPGYGVPRVRRACRGILQKGRAGEKSSRTGRTPPAALFCNPVVVFSDTLVEDRASERSFRRRFINHPTGDPGNHALLHCAVPRGGSDGPGGAVTSAAQAGGRFPSRSGFRGGDGRG
jgi:hypothetical protein